MTSVRFSGSILAGGKSSRMGRDKSALVVAGETLLARQLRLLAEAGCAERWVSVAAVAADRPALPPAARALVDRYPESGPLAGVERSLAEARHDLVLVLAVDLPALTAELLRSLCARATPGVGVVPVRRGRLEPLVAVYPRVARAEALARLERGELAMQPFVRAGLAAGWLREHVVAGDEERCFVNWNRPVDLAGRGPHVALPPPDDFC